MPTFSVITPSWNSLDHLARCTRSVEDQLSGKAVEHLVMDGGSTDGTPDWLAKNRPDGTWISEPDRGMYDAINKGLDRARGDFISYLNCDEQYLPGTLSRMDEFFRRHPSCDMVFGDALLVRPDGSYLASRRGYPPRRLLMAVSHLYVLSCTMFFRRSLVDRGFRFDSRWKTIGDLDFVMRVLAAGHRAGYCPGFSSAFTMTGQNLGAGEMAKRELMAYRRGMPFWVRSIRIPLNATRFLIKARSGAYRSDRGTSYAVYAGDATERKSFTIRDSTWRWPDVHAS